jgi:hypothetical protein
MHPGLHVQHSRAAAPVLPVAMGSKNPAGTEDGILSRCVVVSPGEMVDAPHPGQK